VRPIVRIWPTRSARELAYFFGQLAARRADAALMPSAVSSQVDKALQ
jgi:hypothetical protein